jgi:capsular polysaccharide export protein
MNLSVSTIKKRSDMHAVFLQGMPCALFRLVGNILQEEGARVTRVNICPGDWLFWHDENCISFKGYLRDWPEFIEAFFFQQGVTDLVLLGEQRDYHKEAITIACRLGIRVSVTDFGYLRPDWITFERDGMGGNSLFPKSPEEILDLASALNEPNFQRVFSDSTLGMVSGDLAYNFANVFLGWLYPHYRRSDRRPPTLIYTVTSALFLLKTRFQRNRNVQRVSNIASGELSYFVFPLQLDHDFQIIAYSNFSGMEEAIEFVIASFSAYAPLNFHLIIKAHPWDAGLKNWRRIVLNTAKEYGVENRVQYLDGGDLDTLSRFAKGMITVNSTSGLSALLLDCPVKTIGQAIFDLEGLSFQQSLDLFWKNASPPDRQLLAAFLKLLASDYQIRGVFFEEQGMRAAVNEMSKRLLK